MTSQLQLTIQALLSTKEDIDPQRCDLLAELGSLIANHLKKGPVVLNFICTHNSRRSQISQAWGIAAAAWFGIKNIQCVSGGTEVTSFNRRAVLALNDQGFEIKLKVDTKNAVYTASLADGEETEMYSKTYQQATIEPFIAVMTCTNADDNCPLVSGATARFSLPFTDPGHSDGSPEEASIYLSTANQIGREMLFLFSCIRKNIDQS